MEKNGGCKLGDGELFLQMNVIAHHLNGGLHQH